MDARSNPISNRYFLNKQTEHRERIRKEEEIAKRKAKEELFDVFFNYLQPEQEQVNIDVVTRTVDTTLEASPTKTKRKVFSARQQGVSSSH